MKTNNVFLVISIIFYGSLANAESFLTRIGYAHSLDDNTLLYTEHHHEAFSDNVVRRSSVIYKDVDGDRFAEKKVDFTTSPFLPEFSLQNDATGHQESTRFEEDGYRVRFLEKADKKAREKSLEYSSDAISDAGFDNFIISNWQEIIAGNKFNRDFLIPGMLRFFNFRIYQKEIVEQDDQKYRVLYIEPDSFLLRAVSSPSRLYYDMDKPVLRRFEGVSNMRDPDGNNYRVSIHYENASSLVSTLD